MDANQQALRLQVLVERYKQTQLRFLTPIITKLEQSVREVLADENLNELKYNALARELTIADQKAQAAAAPVLSTYRKTLEAFVREQIDIESVVWGIPTVDVERVVRAVFDAPLGIDGDDRGRTLDVFILSFWNTSRNAVFGALKRGSFEKRANASLLVDIRGTRKLSFQDGLSAKIHRAAIAVNNTAVQHAVSALRDALLEGSTVHEILWSSLFEKNTCSRCGGHDGHIYPVGSGPRSPIHMSCRCMMVPVTKDTSSDYNFTYYDWLKQQDRAFVELALGVKRAALFLDGGLSVAKFISLKYDKNFEPITLAELRKIAPSVFAKAGV
jgi:hypothetical protein